jgi:hypothetical protein
MPPAATTWKSPHRRSLADCITARIPEPQTLLRVTAPVATGQPAPSAACRAGAWPSPAGSTQPMVTCSMSSGVRPARSIAAARARAPSTGAETSLNAPWNEPIGVRAALRMTTSCIGGSVSEIALWRWGNRRWGEAGGCGRRSARPAAGAPGS